MNRIILIGNGFDLAHDIETSYSQFLSDYWKNTIEGICSSNDSSVYENDQMIIQRCPLGIKRDFDFKTLDAYIAEHRGRLKFKNSFLRHISRTQNLNSWVDIENEYYELLNNYSITDGKELRNKQVSKLNKEFREVQDLLEKYLDKKVTEKNLNNNHHYSIGEKIYNEFSFDDFTEKGKYQLVREYKGNLIGNITKEIIDDNKENQILSRIKNRRDNKSICDFLNVPKFRNSIDLKPSSILFLNFNYTSTYRLYFSDHIPLNAGYTGLDYAVVNIHGEILNKQNPIIFGYGDELDEKYKLLEKTNENSLLENIKSIKYLETSNYKKLLEYIESDLYQVCIMGHSCGTSDRTLLNTLFEHDNCQSIKFFYHKKENGDDNYSDTIRNISRNFNNKVVMRDRVVNKKYCEPLL